MRKRDNKSFEPFESFDAFFEQAEERPGYWVELAKIEFTEKVLARMKETGLRRIDLASRLGVQPGLVTRLLNGKNNFELATMVRIAQALECELGLRLQPVETNARRIDLSDQVCVTEENVPWDRAKLRKIEKQERAQLVEVNMGNGKPMVSASCKRGPDGNKKPVERVARAKGLG